MVYRKSAGESLVLFEPYRAYVLSRHQLEKFSANPEISKIIFKVADLEPRIPNFNAKAGKPGKLLFYNGSGGYGDQVIAWPVVKYLANMGYQVDVFSDPGNESCWWMQPWVNMVTTMPTQKASWDRYASYAVFETVANNDEHPDQEHPVDAMFRKIGIDPATIAPEEKVVRPNFTFTERNAARNLMPSLKLPQARYGFLQLAASVPLRSFTPEEAIGYMKAIATAYPDIAWLSITDNNQDPAYKIAIQTSGMPNLYAHTFHKLRDLWAAIEGATAVVSVDSMSVHVAGSLGVPCVGIWGPVNPIARTKYYQNHIPLFDPTVCPYAPCFHASGPNLPAYCPPEPVPAKSCAVMRASTPDKVVTALRDSCLQKSET